MNILKLLPPNFLKISEVHISDFALRQYQLNDLLTELEDILFGYGNSLTRERARQSGKTASITILSLTCMTLLPELAKHDKYLNRFPSLHIFKNGFNIGIVAPKLEQAKITLKRIKKISLTPAYKKLLDLLEMEVTNRSLTTFVLSNGSSIIAMSGNPVSATEGESVHLMIFDEAQKLKPYSWHKVYAPMVSSTNGTIVSYGTSWTAKYTFYNQIQINKKKGLHSRVICNEVEKYSENYKKWLANERTRLSIDSIEFQLNFLLIWHLQTGNPITTELWDNIDMFGNYAPGDTTSDNLYVGIDWGKTTTNTFVTIIEKTLDCLKYIDLLEIQGDDYPQQHIAIQKLLNQYPNIKKIWSESTGVGDTNTDFLKSIYASKVEPVTAFNLPSLHDKLLNEIKYKRLIRPKMHDFGAWKSLTRQFLNCEKQFKGSSFQLIGPGEELDDAIDSSCLAVGAALNNHLFNFTYKKKSSPTPRVMLLNRKRILTKNKIYRKNSEYQNHLSFF